MGEEERTARAPGSQGVGDEVEISPAHTLRFHEPPQHVNDIARRLIESAVEVHRCLGPGYAESVYESALAVELGLRGIPFERQAGFRVDYKGHQVGEGRMDLLVERILVVELKAVDRFTEVHISQALAYLKATGHPLALLINFNVPVLMRGVKRIVLNRTMTPEEGPAKARRSQGDPS
jgi:GxxExxY protein